jgi:hypothetical protein
VKAAREALMKVPKVPSQALEVKKRAAWRGDASHSL